MAVCMVPVVVGILHNFLLIRTFQLKYLNYPNFQTGLELVANLYTLLVMVLVITPPVVRQMDPTPLWQLLRVLMLQVAPMVSNTYLHTYIRRTQRR